MDHFPFRPATRWVRLVQLSLLSGLTCRRPRLPEASGRAEIARGVGWHPRSMMMLSAMVLYAVGVGDGWTGSGEKDGVKKTQFYAYVKQRTKSRPSIGPLKDRAARVVQEEREMAEVFNEFFSSVFTRENLGDVPDPQQQHAGEMLPI